MRTATGTWARNDHEPAETQADLLESTFQPNDTGSTLISDVSPARNQPIKLTSPGEIKAVM